MIMDRVESKGIVEFETGLERELEDCRNRCVELELEIQKKNSEFELLEGKFGGLVVEKLAIEDELGVLKKRNDELEEWIARTENGSNILSIGEKGMGRIVDLTEEMNEEDKVFQLMIENKVLDCEKKKAESEVEVWKAKCKELESRVLELEDSLVLKGGKYPLAGKLKIEPELPEMGMKEISEARGLKDGASFAIQAENEVMDSHETIHAAAGVISTRHHSVKEIGDLQASGTPCKQSTHVEGGKGGSLSGTELEYGSRVRKQLAFGEGSPSKKMAPSTPGGVRRASVGVIDISDSDGEPAMLRMPTIENQEDKLVSVSTDSVVGGTMNEKESAYENNIKKAFLDQSDEEDIFGYKGCSPFSSTPKRKRASNIVTSDTESEDDDNVPICKLKTMHLQEVNTDLQLNSYSVPATVSGDKFQESASRRRLVSLRKFEENWLQRSSTCSNLNTKETDCYPGIPTNEDGKDTEMEEDGSESEGESLGGFIVDCSDVSDIGDASGESEDTSDGNMDYGGIMSKLRRDRDHNLKWELEADMLAAFGKDPELCMKAVCALYRQQTSEEKLCKGTIYSNQRGFSQCDANRGTSLAEFLTDGDPKGDLQKSVKELEDYNSKGAELCRKLATHYSKQLFAIYKNKEDPFFLPS